MGDDIERKRTTGLVGDAKVIHDYVANLIIEHPDRDRYDGVWNLAVLKACEQIELACHTLGAGARHTISGASGASPLGEDDVVVRLPESQRAAAVRVLARAKQMIATTMDYDERSALTKVADAILRHGT